MSPSRRACWSVAILALLSVWVYQQFFSQDLPELIGGKLRPIAFEDQSTGVRTCSLARYGNGVGVTLVEIRDPANGFLAFECNGRSLPLFRVERSATPLYFVLWHGVEMKTINGKSFLSCSWRECGVRDGRWLVGSLAKFDNRSFQTSRGWIKQQPARAADSGNRKVLAELTESSELTNQQFLISYEAGLSNEGEFWSR